MKGQKKPIRNFSIRIPEKLAEELKYVADYEDRSMNSQILFLIRKCVAEFKKEHGGIELDDPVDS